MTDKQIIIDVSDCSELCGTKCHILMSCTNTSKSDSCSEMPNCYYKQLKRKEQECEELKLWKKEHLKDVEFIERNPVIDILNSMADNILLEQRNEKLKQTLIEIKEIAENNKHSVLCFTAFEGDAIEVNNEPMAAILQKISEVEENE